MMSQGHMRQEAGAGWKVHKESDSVENQETKPDNL